MAILLGVIGLVAAVWTWRNIHPVAGLVIGVLFVGGAGWQMLGALLGLLRPSARHAFGPEGRQFIRAWELRFGEMRPGRTDNLPPPGLFQAWLREFRRTGVSADTWLDQQLSPAPAPLRARRHTFHVPLERDGRGMTVTVTVPDDGGRHETTWRFDPGVQERWQNPPLRFQLDVMMEQARASIEEQMGLPVTFPHVLKQPGRIHVTVPDHLKRSRGTPEPSG